MPLLNDPTTIKFGAAQVERVYLGNSIVWENFVPISATGGTITDIDVDGVPFRVHTFTSSGTFEVSSVGTTDGSIEYLIVAGGGRGGEGAVSANRGGGGGGAGGLISGSSTVSPQSYSFTVGLGGTTGNGGNSTGFSLTAIGGGAGGNLGSNGSSGGSGGGAGNLDQGSRSGGAGTSGQGNAGGNSVDDPNGASGGGGGGFSAVGTTGTGNFAAGGAGLLSSITGTEVEYAKGGDSFRSGQGTAPPANTGNGAPGCGDRAATTAQIGADGIVVVRYPIGQA